MQLTLSARTHSHSCTRTGDRLARSTTARLAPDSVEIMADPVQASTGMPMFIVIILVPVTLAACIAVVQSFIKCIKTQQQQRRQVAEAQARRERGENPWINEPATINVTAAVSTAEQQARPIFAMSETRPTAAGSTSAADTIRELKRLCDDGVITQAEFESKKKILLEAIGPVPTSWTGSDSYAPPPPGAPPPYHNGMPVVAMSAADGDDVHNRVLPANSDESNYDWSAGLGARAAGEGNTDLYGEMSPANGDEDVSYFDTAPGPGVARVFWDGNQDNVHRHPAPYG
jgi:hypothetical protein